MPQIALDWAKVLLLWSVIASGSVKFFLAVRILYTLYGTALGALGERVGNVARFA